MVELEAEIAALKAERDDAIKTWRIMDACRQHAEEECERLRAALEWYANKKHWPMKFDYGEIARRALGWTR
jgi:hypothetical protein